MFFPEILFTDYNWDFIEPLENYTDIMKNHIQIIFLNYSNYDVCIETINNYNIGFKQYFRKYCLKPIR